MDTTTVKQGTITRFEQDMHLLTWIDAFLIDRKAQNMSKGTLYFYLKKMELFSCFCDGQGISQVTEIEAGTIREFLVWLENNGHNPGGINAVYRAIRAFLN
ncbi:MAG TPA: phage integrase SAM-like domain-containing protein [Anaerolineaceae bacterium]|nr:phage integrase SAM-like domain-containing protein [Anaerolineaceae bacterium]